MRLKKLFGIILVGALFLNAEAALAGKKNRNQHSHKSQKTQKSSKSKKSQKNVARGTSCQNPKGAEACMACNCFNEAGNQGYDGQVAVGKVVMTRIGIEGFPNTVCGVVKQDFQFSWYNSTSTRQAIPKGHSCFKAAKESMKFRGYFADHYYASYIRKPRWARNMKSVKTIGVHKFYSGNPSAYDKREQAAAVNGIASLLLSLPSLNGLIDVPAGLEQEAPETI